MLYSEWIRELEAEFVGKRIEYGGSVYRVAKVDYNGIIHIDRPSRFNDTTAVYEPHEARSHIMPEEEE